MVYDDVFYKKKHENIFINFIEYSFSSQCSNFFQNVIMQVMELNGISLLLVYWTLFIATNFVNKYVLSVLKFTYPTIFQGWQTLVGAVVLRGLSLVGKIDLAVADINRSSVAPWLPAMLMFVCKIYAASKALSKVPIPVVMSIHSITEVFNLSVQVVAKKEVHGITKFMSLLVIAASSIMISWTDPQFDGGGYFWLSLYIIFSGFISVYSAVCSSNIKLSDLDKLYCNYICSVIVLAPSSYFLGDALAATEFPFLYFYKFYIGCICSGLFGVFLNICAIKIIKTQGDVADDSSKTVRMLHLHEITAIAKILVSLLSVAVFSMILTGSHMLWISVCLTANLVYAADDRIWSYILLSKSKPTINGNIEKDHQDLNFKSEANEIV